MEFSISGRKCRTLDTRHWTLDAGHRLLLIEELTSDPDPAKLNYLHSLGEIF